MKYPFLPFDAPHLSRSAALFQLGTWLREAGWLWEDGQKLWPRDTTLFYEGVEATLASIRQSPRRKGAPIAAPESDSPKKKDHSDDWS